LILARRLIASLALVSLPLPTWSAGLADSDAALTRRLDARFAGDRTGACIVAAVIDDAKVVARGRACAGTRADGPPPPDAAFEIGSVTKTMTAYLVADLIERGQWSLDDPIARHLPEGTVVPRQGDRQILVRDILTHSSGLPPLPPGMESADPADPYASLGEQQLLSALGKVRLERPIGSQFEYSNFAMMLLSLAVARSDGGDFEAALRDRLFKPLSMAGASVAAPGPAKAAQGHLPSGLPVASWSIAPNLAGAGMVKARLADMELYARAALGDGPQDIVQRFRLSEQPLAHGHAMAWETREVQGRQLLIHEGGTGGFSSLVVLEPAHRRAVVLLADTALADLGGIGDLGLSLIGLDWPVSAPRRVAAATPQEVRALAGEYDLGGMHMRIWAADDGRVMAQAAGQSAFELLHDSRGDFYPASFSALLTPLPASTKDAPVERFVWRQLGGLVEAHRLGAAGTMPTATNPAWRDWAGEYRLLPQFSVRVFEREGALMVEGTGQQALAAEVVGKDRIAVRQVDATFDFERDLSGRVIAVVLHQHGQALRGERRVDPK
jgi:CubicO group peptidase (beta-lactamase class C family)